MKIAIVDDEVHCIESLVIYLNTLFPEMVIEYKSNKVQEAVDRLSNMDIDLLFLDIEMPGLSGFELLEQLPNRKFDVIFTTAYSQYAVQAFKARAINYLLKPIDGDELRAAVDEWKTELPNRQGADTQLEQLLEHLKKEGILKNKISVPISDGYEFIEVDRIMYCQSDRNYTTLFLSDGRNVLISKTMKEVENTLDNFFFIRVHRSYLVNPNYLKEYHRNDGGYLTMQDNKEIPISQQKRDLITGLFDAISR
jgi:two-component system LytT family response regulator